ncbi:unnamed protein product [Macrosiphum euphorbiae]|uniref:HAT C-terminal dimerisation domain-containing protein n=1 Tax=Macrosiphum euphorbiae TaxID=13131 RepID=A0AAV0VL39_9HEMI|nr:unnamed protein product [Macrosiphum euphorbiae]
MYLNNFDTNTTQVIFELQNGLQKRFSNLEMSNFLTRCTFLDPIFKQFPLSENTATETKNNIINATTQVTKNKSDNLQDQIAITPTNDTLVERDEFCIWNSFDTTASRIAPLATNTSKGIIEVNIGEALLLITGDPLKWWKEHGYNYPNLSILARQKCCSMAKSVLCERVFFKSWICF